MAAVEWIKLDVGLFGNRKIKQIAAMKKGDTLIVIWLKLLILAANSECGELSIAKGLPYDAETLAPEINKPLATVREALETFKRYGMIEDINGVLFIKNWEKYQNVDGMEKVREQTRIRNIAYRERKRNKAANVTDDVTDDVTVTRNDATDKDIDKDIDIESKNNNTTTTYSTNNPSAECNVTPVGGGGDELIAYAANNLQYLSPTNVEELASFRDSLSDDIIRYAIDEACGGGNRTYNYARGILRRIVSAGYKTIGEVKAAEEKWREKNGRTGTTAHRGYAPGQYRPIGSGETVV